MRGLLGITLVLAGALGCAKPVERAIANGNEAARAAHLEEARAAYAEAVAADPGSAHAHVLLGNVLAQLGAREEATQQWSSALAIDGSSIDAKLGLARDALQAADAGVALTLLTGAPTDRVDVRLVHAQAALARGAPHDVDDALADAVWVLSHDQANTTGLYLKGSAELSARKLGDAQATFDQAERGAPKSPLGPYGLARVAAAQARETDALLHLRSAKSIAGVAWQPEAVARDPAFAFLSDSAEFKELVGHTP